MADSVYDEFVRHSSLAYIPKIRLMKLGINRMMIDSGAGKTFVPDSDSQLLEHMRPSNIRLTVAVGDTETRAVLLLLLLAVLTLYGMSVIPVLPHDHSSATDSAS